MKKILLQFVFALCSISTFGQIGINTESPQSTLDIRGKNDTGASGVSVPGIVDAKDGILIPRVSALSTSGTVNGQLVYLVADNGTFTKGFYYWNGTAWTTLAGDPTADAWVDNAAGTAVLSSKPAVIGTATSADTSAILDLSSSTNKGLLIPKIALTSINDVTTIPSPATGLIVFNTANAGTAPNNVKANKFYYFNGTVWDFLYTNIDSNSGASSFSSTILGYTPVKASLRTVPATFAGLTVTERGCKQNPTNSHTYCAYQLSGGMNFYNTFSLAKQIGGYVVTMTSNAERTWVNTNILNATTGYNLLNNIWIGYNKVAFPGNPTQFVWITAEDWVIDWSTSPTSTPENWFNSGEPNNNGGSEGSCHILNAPTSSTRRWNDIAGTTTGYNSGLFDQVIVEFNEP